MNLRIGHHVRRVPMLTLILGVMLSGVLLILLARFYPYPWNFTTFPRVTRTASGMAGDPINLVLIGSQEQITQSFHQAGWLTPDPITPQSTARIAADSLVHRSYQTAPVSTLYVFGRAQDLAFEKPTNDVQNRGHIRLWQTGTRISGQTVWVGQASYDRGIELSASNHSPTHHIAPTVDWERNRVGSDLEKTGLVTADVDAAFAVPIFSARNGGGDFYESDGDLLVINYTLVSPPLHPQTVVVSGLKDGIFLLYDLLVDILVTVPAVLGALLLISVAVIAGLVLVRARQRHEPTVRGQPG